MRAGEEERGAPAPYAYVGHLVRIQHAGVDPDARVPVEWRGELVDVSNLGAEVVADGGTRHFVPWGSVARLTLVGGDGER